MYTDEVDNTAKKVHILLSWIICSPLDHLYNFILNSEQAENIGKDVYGEGFKQPRLLLNMLERVSFFSVIFFPMIASITWILDFTSKFNCSNFLQACTFWYKNPTFLGSIFMNFRILSCSLYFEFFFLIHHAYCVKVKSFVVLHVVLLLSSPVFCWIW